MISKLSCYTNKFIKIGTYINRRVGFYFTPDNLNIYVSPTNEPYTQP